MKKLVGILLLILSFAAFGATQKAPNFKAVDQYNIEQSIEKYKGKFIILTFWATWCPACQKELGGLDNLYKKYGENKKDVIFLGVTNEEADVVKNFLKERNYSYPSVKSEDAFKKFFVRAFPTTYMIDNNGNISNFLMGAIPEDSLDKYIQIEVLRKSF